MLDFRLILRFFDQGFILKLLFLAMLYSLVPLFEIFLLFYLGGLVGNYLTLSMAASTGLLGVIFGVRGVQKNLVVLKEKVRSGQYPGEEFLHLVGILIGGIFLLTPGFFTDFLGFLLFIPPFRRGLGRWIVRRTRIDLKELYEYLKLYDV
jgi:UPF0716 protein FxsA